MFRAYSTERNELEERLKPLVDKLRSQCLMKGVGGIKSLSVVFRHMDKDFSKRLCRREFEAGLKTFGLNVEKNDVDLLFRMFDTDRNEHIDFMEMVARLRPEMPRKRKEVVNEAFDRLDHNGDNVLRLEDLQSKSYFPWLLFCDKIWARGITISRPKVL